MQMKPQLDLWGYVGSESDFAEIVCIHAISDITVFTGDVNR